MIFTFRRLRQKTLPKWLLDGEGGLVGAALDLLKDAALQRLDDGHWARFPQRDPTGRRTAPDDALTLLGRDRGIIRGIEESSQSYAKRLLPWLDDHIRRGNPLELMHQLAGYVNDPAAHFRIVDVRGNWFSRAADGTESWLLNTGNWNWDGLDYGTRWSRFWVIIYPGARWVQGPEDWGTGEAWGENPLRTWGTSATPEQVTAVRGIVDYWKPGGTKCVGIIVAFDENSFNPSSPEPDGQWGREGRTVDGVRVPSRLTTAAYWNGT